MALHLSDIKTSLRAFTTFSSTSTTPNANSRLFNERLQNRDANHGARLHDEPAKRPTLHLVTLQEHRLGAVTPWMTASVLAASAMPKGPPVGN